MRVHILRSPRELGSMWPKAVKRKMMQGGPPRFFLFSFSASQRGHNLDLFAHGRPCREHALEGTRWPGPTPLSKTRLGATPFGLLRAVGLQSVARSRQRVPWRVRRGRPRHRPPSSSQMQMGRKNPADEDPDERSNEDRGRASLDMQTSQEGASTCCVLAQGGESLTRSMLMLIRAYGRRRQTLPAGLREYIAECVQDASRILEQ